MRPFFLSNFSFLILFLIVNTARAELSINPPVSEVGTSVVVSGGSFDFAPVNNQVTFTGKPQPVPAEWVSEDGKHLLVRVPQGVADGPVSVSVKNKPIGNVAFKVKPPTAWPGSVVWIGIVIALFFRTFINNFRASGPESLAFHFCNLCQPRSDSRNTKNLAWLNRLYS